jgi:hypothetical protein
VNAPKHSVVRLCHDPPVELTKTIPEGDLEFLSEGSRRDVVELALRNVDDVVRSQAVRGEKIEFEFI